MAHFTLILAAGSGLRLNSQIPKQFLEISGLPMLMHSVTTFSNAQPNSKIFIGLPSKHISLWEDLCKDHNFNIEHEVYHGGNNRLETVLLGLKKINKIISNKSDDLIAIHDAARPFLSIDFILELIKSAKKHGSAVPFLRMKDSIRKIDSIKRAVSYNRNREDYILIQTPQVFSFQDIYKSYSLLEKSIRFDPNEKPLNSNVFFDDASIYNFYNKISPKLILGREYNIKITTQIDFMLAEKIYKLFKQKT